MTRTRILLAEDHAAMRERVVRLLDPEFEVVGVVDNGKALIEAARRMLPDLVVADICMPILNGIEATQRLREGGSTAKVVFLTVNEDPDFVRAALAAGGVGYVVKSRLASDLRPAIKEAMAGRVFVSPTVTVPSLEEGETQAT